MISEYSGIATLTGTRERDREGWAHIETLRRLGYHKEAEAARKELIYGWGKEASAELVMVGWGSVVTPATTPVKRMTVPAKQGTTVAAETAPVAPVWPKTAQEMNAFLKVDGKAIPDTLTTPGRNKTVWELGQSKITLEQHPYHPNAPAWHKDPHWHLDTPGNRHQRFLPGDPIPGY